MYAISHILAFTAADRISDNKQIAIFQLLVHECILEGYNMMSVSIVSNNRKIIILGKFFCHIKSVSSFGNAVAITYSSKHRIDLWTLRIIMEHNQSRQMIDCFWLFDSCSVNFAQCKVPSKLLVAVLKGFWNNLERARMERFIHSKRFCCMFLIKSVKDI